ncbi:MAG TPA: hypothetical protein VLA12_19140 [Planctomycetaceae bacterium]|nr:hypothetical protein [Planctomycetaceae bacterium]
MTETTLTWEPDEDDEGNTSWYARSAYTDDDYMFRLYPKLEDNRIVWWTDHDNELNGGEDDFYLSLEEAKAACEAANRTIIEDDVT